MKRNRKLLCTLLVLALCLLTAMPGAAWAETAEDFEPSLIGLEDGQTPEPEDARFLLLTPEDLAISFGVEWQSIGFVSVSDVTGLWEGERILLYTDGAAFVNLDDPYETIPFAITDAWGNDVICLYDEELGAQTVELFISISSDAWDRAALGIYAATIDSHAVVE